MKMTSVGRFGFSITNDKAAKLVKISLASFAPSGAPVKVEIAITRRQWFYLQADIMQFGGEMLEEYISDTVELSTRA